MPPIFEAAAVREATGVSEPMLKHWTAPKSGVVMLHSHDDRPGRVGRGNKAGYSLSRVHQLATMGELARFGIGPSVSANVAISFTDAGGEAQFDGTHRPIGELFSEGTTLLVFRPGKTYGDVVNIRPGQPWFDAWTAISEGALGVVILDMNRLIDSVHRKLGIES